MLCAALIRTEVLKHTQSNQPAHTSAAGPDNDHRAWGSAGGEPGVSRKTSLIPGILQAGDQLSAKLLG